MKNKYISLQNYTIICKFLQWKYSIELQKYNNFFLL